MERFPHFTTDLQFIERLVAEESVHCMPGKCFNYPGYMRLVLTLPLRLLNEALDRIHSFCRWVMLYLLVVVKYCLLVIETFDNI